MRTAKCKDAPDVLRNDGMMDAGRPAFFFGSDLRMTSFLPQAAA